MSKILQDGIIKTVAYFDLFDYPLTTFEIWKWLWQEDGEMVSYGVVQNELEKSPEIKKYIVQCGAFWYLRGREKIVSTREERYRFSAAKLRRAHRIARLFSYIPWVEGIAVCNSLGYRNASAKSDIDLFIIVRPGTIWLVRFLTTGFLAAFGLRPTAKKTANSFCLSFFVASGALSLEKLQKSGGDPHLIYWLTQFAPLFGRGNVWQKFCEANLWIKKFLPNALLTTGHGTWLYCEHFFTLTKVHDRELLSDYLISTLNNTVKRWQISHLPQRLQERANRGTDVVLNDQVLKFHDNDRREEYRQKWINLQQRLGLISS